MRLIKSLIFPVLFLCSFLSVTAQTGPTIFVEPVINNIRVGALVGNKNLAFGVKNIVQEIINEQDSLVLIGVKEKAEYTIQVELIFFDIVNTNSGIAVFHQDKSTTVIRMKGVLYKGGKKIKTEFGEGKSTEISTSTIIIDEGGKFNQESASSAIKKTTINLLDKLL
jgi:general stress protein CsbA